MLFWGFAAEGPDGSHGVAGDGGGFGVVAFFEEKEGGDDEGDGG